MGSSLDENKLSGYVVVGTAVTRSSEVKRRKSYKKKSRLPIRLLLSELIGALPRGSSQPAGRSIMKSCPLRIYSLLVDRQHSKKDLV